MKQIVTIPFGDKNLKLNIDLRGIKWTPYFGKQISKRLQENFEVSSLNLERFSPFVVYSKSDSSPLHECPQVKLTNRERTIEPIDVLNLPAQEIFDDMIRVNLFTIDQDLTCQFASELDMQRFISAFGNFVSPRSESMVHIPSKIRENNQLAVVFPNPELRERFMQLLAIEQNNLFTVNPSNPKELLIDLRNVESKYSITKLPRPFWCTDEGFLALTKNTIQTFFNKTPKPLLTQSCVNIINSFVSL